MPINSFLYPGAKFTPAYEVANSLRLDGSSAYLSRTFGTPTNASKFTYSGWVKRSGLSASHILLFANGGNAQNYANIMFNSADDFFWHILSSNSEVSKLRSDAKYRDASAWYHLVFAWDSTQATASNRTKMYVNGVELDSFDVQTNTAQDTNYHMNTAVEHIIGAEKGNTGGSVGNYFGGYMAEVVFIDGQALDPTSFGEFDSDSGIWKPKDVSGLTFGNNGFYLDFKDSSALGNDVSGNNNDFSVTNLAATDQTTDTCTNNFATFNPLLNNWTAISEGNLKVTNTSQAYRDVFSTVALTSGKWYVECRIDTEIGGTYPIFGIADASQYSYPAQVNLLGRSSLGWGFQTDGNYYNNNADAGNWSTLDNGDIIGFYLDLDSSQNTLKVYKNGSSELSLNISDPVDGYYFGCSTYQEDSVSGSINFGNPSFSISSGNSDANGYGNFEYSPTLSGVNYYAICTKNLAEYG